MSGGPTARVVVVDDEPVLAGMVKNYLERAGMETRTCGDGLQAVELVREWRPDVVVLDLGLPGLDGVEVCRQVRTFSDCYVVMLTGTLTPGCGHVESSMGWRKRDDQDHGPEVLLDGVSSAGR